MTLVARVWRSLTLFWELLKHTYERYSRERAELLAASLAFYMLLSLAPLIIIAVAVAGLVLGEGAARAEMTRLLSTTMGPKATETINAWVDEAWRNGAVASVVGFALALFTASRVVSQLEQVLNQIWNVEARQPESIKESIRRFLRRRVSAILVVMASGPLLLAVLATRTVLSTTTSWIYAGTGLAVVVQVSQLVFAVALVALLTALVLKVVPDVDMGWRATWIGAALTSVLFNLGNVALGLYLGRASVGATYGAAGSAIVILMWLYFSGMFFLFGAEFAQTCSRRFAEATDRDEAEPDTSERHRAPA